MNRFAAVWMAVGGCGAPGSRPGEGAGWIVDVGLPDQDVPLVALTAQDRDVWLAARPRAVVDAGFAAVAAPFAPLPEAPDAVRLVGLYDAGDAHITLVGADRAQTGLDHDVSFTVAVRADDGAGAELWLAVALDGDPGCGGDRFPTAIAAFDADRRPLPLEGTAEDAELSVAGVRVAVTVPEQLCVVAERRRRR